MKTQSNILRKSCFFALALMLAALFITTGISPELIAQPALPMGNPSSAPIDGGLLFLAAGGGAYAIKKLRDKKRE